MYKHLIDAKKNDFEKALEFLHTELSAIRTGRANSALVENISVDSYGTKSPLKNLASITIPDSRSILIQPWDKGLLSTVEKAISASHLGIQPVNDGLHIRLSIPPLNEERRVELVKAVKQQAEAARIRVRNVREEIWKEIQKQVKEKKVTEDEKFQAQDDLKKLVDENNAKIQEMVIKKETEVMTV